MAEGRPLVGWRRWLRRLRNRANKRLVQLQNELLRNERVLGHPFHLTLEPGNVCNLRCPLCPTTHREARIPSGVLRLENARRILDRLPWIVRMTLSNWGEPFLNKEIFAIIADARARDIEVEVESNFTLFDEAKARALVASGLDRLLVAIDGASQASYERYRVGGRLDDVLANVRTLRRVQEETGDRRTEIVWKFVVNRHNEHELEAARALAAELGLSFRAVTIWAPPDALEDWLPRDRSHTGGRNAQGGPQRCHHLWQAVSVNFNGDVFPCCSEFTPEDKLQNVLEQPFDPVWNGPQYRSRRRRNRGPIDCSECHRDKDTNWHRAWLGPRSEAAAPPPGAAELAAGTSGEAVQDAQVGRD